MRTGPGKGKKPMTGNESTVQELCEKLGFQTWDGGFDIEEEEWESPNVLRQTITMEMGNGTGTLLVVPVTCRLEFGESRLDIRLLKPTGKVA